MSENIIKAGDEEKIRQARLSNLQDQINKTQACDHPKTTLRRKGPHYGNQCTRCGAGCGGWVKKSDIENPDEVPAWDETLRDNYFNTVHDLTTELRKLQRECEKEDFDRWYKEYLLSPQWQAKRIKVFERCARLCEGCRKSKATIVHHLTYAHKGNEFLFELVGLCPECHSEIHTQEEIF